MTTKYIGKYADGGSKNSFYKMKGSRYGFKSFPNKSLADFAHAVQRDLSVGCTYAPRVYSPVCKIRIPNHFAVPDGKGGYKYFDVKPIYRLLITSCDLYNLYNLGFKPKRLIVSGNKPARDAKQFIKILKVENNNRIDDTYCFTEPKRNMGVFNGIITGQCTEII